VRENESLKRGLETETPPLARPLLKKESHHWETNIFRWRVIILNGVRE